MSGHSKRRATVRHRTEKPSAPKKQTTALSPREQEVMSLLAEGCLYKEIAEKLGIGFETVRTHLQHIYQKLQVRTRTEAAVRFLSRNGN